MDSSYLDTPATMRDRQPVILLQPVLTRALDDIQESIKELQYYRATVFKTSTPSKQDGGSKNNSHT